MRCSAPSVHSCLPSSHRQPPRFRCDDAKRRWMLAVASCPSDKPLLFASPTVCVCHPPPFPRQSPGGWGPHRGLLQVVAAINRSRHPTGLGGCLSHGGAGVSLPWWQGFGERQTLACVVPHSPGPRRSLTRRETAGLAATAALPSVSTRDKRPRPSAPMILGQGLSVLCATWWNGGWEEVVEIRCK